jgi:hypothetical protein
MATFTGKVYGKTMLSIWNKEVDYDTDTITVLGTTSSHTIDQDAHDYLNDITNEVASANGYVRKTLASKTTTYTGATNKHALDAADLQWTTASFTFRNLHIADTSPGSDATRPLLAYQSGDGDTTGGGGNLDFAWNASGIIESTVG